MKQKIKTVEEILDEYLPAPGSLKDNMLKAIHAYHNQFAGDGWISVEDRLPEKSGSYLCYLKNYTPDRADRTEIVMFSTNDWWPTNKMTAVTHWQLLPPAPQNTKES